ncbi:uncharacterized protein LOC114788009 isoform X2 [Denticeps clupeoides]|uniref:uncharacterized protein LOC114788009 isoform X2 n=1 Tax=Denticeps clupeoides TaxID=299321 RepID=UPI0010A3D83C|nr:uncharacterized protein LOC114788009 isoform X2 [Denticeps clupeoides]
MAGHVVLSYQWAKQPLVKRTYDRLKESGWPAWMDVEDAASGSDSDVTAGGVEGAAIVCPFMTPAYQGSRSSRRELNCADGQGVTIVPVMVAKNWEASEWLGLLTAGLLWVDFRDAEKDEEHFDRCMKHLEAELMFVAGNLLAGETPLNQIKPSSETSRPRMVKAGRSFRHALTQLYIVQQADGITVALHENPGDNRYWEEIRGTGCKYYRNLVYSGHLGFDPNGDTLHTKESPSGSEGWLLMVDERNQSHERAVIIKNKSSGKILAVQNGCLIGLSSYTEDCKWFLE